MKISEGNVSWQKKRDRRYFLVRDLANLICSDRRLAVELTSFPNELLGNALRESLSIVKHRVETNFSE